MNYINFCCYIKLCCKYVLCSLAVDPVFALFQKCGLNLKKYDVTHRQTESAITVALRTVVLIKVLNSELSRAHMQLF